MIENLNTADPVWILVGALVGYTVWPLIGMLFLEINDRRQRRRERKYWEANRDRLEGLMPNGDPFTQIFKTPINPKP